MKKLSVVGKRIPNVDSFNKVTGQAEYSIDLKFPKMLHGKILRSPLPHAKILDINASKAQRLAGVKAVITAKDVPKVKYGLIKKDKEMLASDKVRYVGDAVAAIAAIDEDIAEEALDLMEVDYEELIPVFDPEEALKPGVPRVHDFENELGPDYQGLEMDASRNIAAEFHAERGEPDEAFRKAYCVLEDRFVTPLVHQCHLEPDDVIASFDKSGKIIVWTGVMDPFVTRMEIAQCLQIGEGQIKLLNQPYIGGAFGTKCETSALYPICAFLAMKAERPVKIVHTMEEVFSAGYPREPIIIHIKMAFTRDGILVARDIDLIGDVGAYANYSLLIPSRCVYLTGSLYNCQNFRVNIKCVYTNKTPVGPFRGFGGPQGAFAVESMMDMAAEELGLDPMEMRLKNIHKAGDITVHGFVIGSTGLRECLEKVAYKANWSKKEKQADHGIGIACSFFECDERVFEGFGGSVAFVKIFEDGKVKILTGETDYGQGTHTVFCQIAAEELGVPIEDVEILATDTDTSPFALGPYGDRVTVSGGNAVRLAAIDARKQLFNVAAEMLEANPEDLEIKDRKIFIKGSPEKAVSLAEVSQQSIFFHRGGSAILGKGVDEKDTQALDLKTLYGNVSTAYTFAAQIADVEVDRETGQVKLLNFITANDLGKAINPLTAEGQAEGSVAQGLGFGLMEEMVYERALINPDFLNYKVPTVLDVPPITAILVESNDPNTLYGAKGAGEPSIVPTAPAIANAIYAAVGIRIKELPITPKKIIRALGG